MFREMGPIAILITALAFAFWGGMAWLLFAAASHFGMF